MFKILATLFVALAGAYVGQVPVWEPWQIWVIGGVTGQVVMGILYS